MKLTLLNEGSQIQLQLNANKAEYHEIWLVESLKAVWEIWTRMGWCSERSNVIKKEDWRDFCPEQQKKHIINEISHFNSITAETDFDIEKSFNDGWVRIIQIVSSIQLNDCYFETGPEILAFRQTVTQFSLVGIRKGLGQTKADYSDFFIFSVKNELISPPIIYLHEFEVDFMIHEAEATVTIKTNECDKKANSMYEYAL